MKDVDALLVLTECTIYHGLDLVRMTKLIKGKELIDLRNIYQLDDSVIAGLNYTSVGKPPAHKKV